MTGRRALTYERNPAEIEGQTDTLIAAEADLARFPDPLQPVARAVIAASGMTDIADDLVFSEDIVARVTEALAAGAPVLCDCEMLAAGIARTRLPADNKVVVTLNDPRVAMLAAKLRTTRAAAAVVLWREHLEGAVVVIGDAPTALFNLLERLDTGWPVPAAILALPAGLVGAVEAKAELAANPRGAPFLTLQGRRGGVAMACVALDAMVDFGA